MADRKLSELTELDTTPSADDELYIRDVDEPAESQSKRITVANLISAVPGGNGGAVLIDEILLDEPATTVTFPDIPGTYRHLQVVILAKGTDTTQTFRGLRVQLNGDTGSSYQQFGLQIGSQITRVATESATFLDIGTVPSATAPAGSAGGISALFHHYATTTFEKYVTTQAIARAGTTSPTMFYVASGGVWMSTSAITSITFFQSTGDFAAGSLFSLYGLP